MMMWKRLSLMTRMPVGVPRKSLTRKNHLLLSLQKVPKGENSEDGGSFPISLHRTCNIRHSLVSERRHASDALSCQVIHFAPFCWPVLSEITGVQLQPIYCGEKYIYQRR